MMDSDRRAGDGVCAIAEPPGPAETQVPGQSQEWLLPRRPPGFPASAGPGGWTPPDRACSGGYRRRSGSWSDACTGLDNPGFAAIARATGPSALRAEKADELDNAVAVVRHHGPALVTVRTARQESAPGRFGWFCTYHSPSLLRPLWLGACRYPESSIRRRAARTGHRLRGALMG